MSPRNWLRSWLTPRPARRARLGVENLEAREVPSAAFAAVAGIGSADAVVTAYDAAVAAGPDGATYTYAVGQFTGTVDFDPGVVRPDGSDVLTHYSPDGARQPDAFAAKYNPDGTLAWVRQMGGALADNARGVDVDAAGGVYVAGTVQGAGTRFGAITPANLGGADAFVTKLDAGGEFLWVTPLGGAYGDTGFDLDVDPDGNPADPVGTVVVAGQLGRPPASGGGSADDVFAAKLRPDGSVAWTRTVGGPSLDLGRGVAADGAGNVIVTGGFNGKVDFDPGTGSKQTYWLTSNQSGSSAFVLKLSPAGDFVWARHLVGGGPGNGSEGHYVAADEAGNVYSAGVLAGSADFDPGKGSATRVSAGGEDVYAWKLTPAGAFAWATMIGTAQSSDRVGALALDAVGNVYLAGNYGGGNAFVARLSGAAGTADWTYDAGPVTAEGVAVTPDGAVTVVGWFSLAAADFDPATDHDGDVLLRAGRSDSFVLTLWQS